MTPIASVSSKTSEQHDDGDDGTTSASGPLSVSTSDPLLELAELILNADFLRSEVDQQSLIAARQEQARALDAEVRALHDAADHVRMGAYLQGGLTLAGAALSASAHAATPAGKLPEGSLEALRGSGQALEGLSQPIGRLLGEAPSMDANADAKRAEQASVDAGSRAEQASHHLERLASNQDRTLDALGSALESQSQGNLAIIANV